MIDPVGFMAVAVCLLYGEMNKKVLWRSAMPVSLARLYPDGFSWHQTLRRLILKADKPDTGDPMEHLTKRMAVPCRSGAGLECYSMHPQARGAWRDREFVEPRNPCEPICRAGLRPLVTNMLDIQDIAPPLLDMEHICALIFL